jgi:hypothetical protein
MTEYKVMNTHDYDTEVHDYSIKMKATPRGIIYKLVRSHDSNWADDYKGTKCLSILNTGDGLIFSKIDRELDYAAAAELYILLKFISKQESQPLYAGIIETIDTIDVQEI